MSDIITFEKALEDIFTRDAMEQFPTLNTNVFVKFCRDRGDRLVRSKDDRSLSSWTRLSYALEILYASQAMMLKYRLENRRTEDAHAYYEYWEQFLRNPDLGIPQPELWERNSTSDYFPMDETYGVWLGFWRLFLRDLELKHYGPFETICKRIDDLEGKDRFVRSRRDFDSVSGWVTEIEKRKGLGRPVVREDSGGDPYLITAAFPRLVSIRKKSFWNRKEGKLKPLFVAVAFPYQEGSGGPSEKMLLDRIWKYLYSDREFHKCVEVQVEVPPSDAEESKLLIRKEFSGWRKRSAIAVLWINTLGGGSHSGNMNLVTWNAVARHSRACFPEQAVLVCDNSPLLRVHSRPDEPRTLSTAISLSADPQHLAGSVSGGVHLERGRGEVTGHGPALPTAVSSRTTEHSVHGETDVDSVIVAEFEELRPYYLQTNDDGREILGPQSGPEPEKFVRGYEIPNDPK